MFAKRHYEKIASAMQNTAPTPADTLEHKAQWAFTVTTLADMFGRDNGAFDRGRFERACLPGANVRACELQP